MKIYSYENRNDLMIYSFLNSPLEYVFLIAQYTAFHSQICLIITQFSGKLYCDSTFQWQEQGMHEHVQLETLSVIPDVRHDRSGSGVGWAAAWTATISLLLVSESTCAKSKEMNSFFQIYLISIMLRRGQFCHPASPPKEALTRTFLLLLLRIRSILQARL